MSNTNEIKANMVYARNFLFNNRFEENILIALNTIINESYLITVDSTKNIVKYCVFEAIEQVKTSHLESAGYIINIIHNLPLNQQELLRWDIDYFLKIELITFLDNFDDIKNARKIILHILKQISN